MGCCFLKKGSLPSIKESNGQTKATDKSDDKSPIAIATPVQRVRNITGSSVPHWAIDEYIRDHSKIVHI